MEAALLPCGRAWLFVIGGPTALAAPAARSLLAAIAQPTRGLYKQGHASPLPTATLSGGAGTGCCFFSGRYSSTGLLS